MRRVGLLGWKRGGRGADNYAWQSYVHGHSLQGRDLRGEGHGIRHVGISGHS